MRYTQNKKMEYKERITRLKAELSIGITKFKGVKNAELIKSLDELNIFADDVKAKYGIDTFFIKIGKKTYDLSGGWGNDLKELDFEGEKFRLVKDTEETIGIFLKEDKQDDRGYNSIKEITLVGKSEIDKEMGDRVKIDGIKALLKDIGIENDLKGYTENDILQAIKTSLQVNGGIIHQSRYWNNEGSNALESTFKAVGFDFDASAVIGENDKILKVLEKDNIRFAFWLNDGELKWLIALPDFKLYNYLDEGRFIWKSSYYENNLTIFDFDTTREIFDLFTETTFNGRNTSSFLTNDEVSIIAHKEKVKQERETQKEKQEKELTSKVSLEFKKNGEITLNNIKRTTDGFFFYGSQKVGYNGLADNYIDFEEKDFNEIFDKICQNFVWNRHTKNFVWNRHTKNISKELFVGSFSVELTEKADRHYLDGIRINKDEVVDVLKRAICYNDKEAYHIFLKEVSYCSIRIHDILSNGLIIPLEYFGQGGSSSYDRRDTKINCKLDLTRKKNKHLVILDKEEFNVKNLNKLIELREWNRQDVNALILIQKLVENTSLTEDKALLVIKNGLKEYREAVKRAKELLKDTISKLDIKEMTIENSEYEGKGYLVKGKSGKEYFVSEDKKVYAYPQMRYICVIDKGRVNLIGTDLLVSRLYALKNDTETKDLIYTLN